MNRRAKGIQFCVLAVILLLAACGPAPAATQDAGLAEQLMAQSAALTAAAEKADQQNQQLIDQSVALTVAAMVTPTPDSGTVDELPDPTDATPTLKPFEVLPEPDASNTLDPNAPVVERIAPNNGFTTGGTPVIITGRNFVVGRGYVRFIFGDKDATDVVCESTTQCTAKTPKQEAGTSVTVKAVLAENLPGQNGNSDTFTFTVLDPNMPIIENVTPSEGPVRGGTEVTITGQNFLIGKQGVNAITRFFFGENEATNVNCDFTTRCKMRSPGGVEGIVLVQAQNNDVKSQHTPGNDYDGFRYNGTPKYGCGVFTTTPKNLTVFHSGEDFVVKWIIKNTGINTWPAGLNLHFSAGVNMAETSSEEIPVLLKPNNTYLIKLDAVAPNNPGTYYMTWIVEGMGCNAYVAIVVE